MSEGLQQQRARAAGGPECSMAKAVQTMQRAAWPALVVRPKNLSGSEESMAMGSSADRRSTSSAAEMSSSVAPAGTSTPSVAVTLALRVRRATRRTDNTWTSSAGRQAGRQGSSSSGSGGKSVAQETLGASTMPPYGPANHTRKHSSLHAAVHSPIVILNADAVSARMRLVRMASGAAFTPACSGSRSGRSSAGFRTGLWQGGAHAPEDAKWRLRGRTDLPST